MKIQDLGPKDVVHCDTEEKANEILKLAHKAGKRWSSGNSFLSANNYLSYKSETCYDFNDGSFCYKEWYLERGYNIIPADTMLSEENITSIDTKPQDVVGSPIEFHPGIYWHHNREFVEAIYLESLGQMEALPGYCELAYQCEKPKSKMVKWTPSLEVPKEFWVKMGTVLEKFYGHSVVSGKNGVEVIGGINIDQDSYSFSPEIVYVMATL